MLVQNHPRVDDILVLKLTTGEDVIAKLVSEMNTSTSDFVVKKPVVLAMVGETRESAQLDMVPFNHLADADKTHTIARSTVVSYAFAATQVADMYRAKTTGLITPKSSLKI